MFNPVIETLEDRRLLSASLSHGILAINGSGHDDVIRVTIDRSNHAMLDVSVNHSVKHFERGEVHKIKISGGRGHDDMRTAANITTPVTMSGGDDDDVLVSGGGDDVLSGGNGDDSLSAGTGDDTLKGGVGDDSLTGGDGNDDVDGNGGEDHIDGGRGRDHFHGDDDQSELEDVQSGDDDHEHGGADDGAAHDATDDNGGATGGGGVDDVLSGHQSHGRHGL
jgi:Ca2+-binding RTX toxin-like protein